MSGSGSDTERFARAQGKWVRGLVKALIRAGVRDVVISPGSRSTPLVLALTEQPELRCVPISDERSAAFFALGQAKVTGLPSVLVCTSGSAPGHYLPAAMEAAASYTPLLVISANRPLEREHCGAPQTTDQRRLFGAHCRGYFEVGLAEPGERSRRALARTVEQAVAATQWPVAGPVQVDIRFRKPLEPPMAPETVDKQTGDDSKLDRPPPRIFSPQVRACPGGLAQLVDRLSKAKRPLIIAGPAALAARRLRPSVRAIVDLGVPAAFEITSQLRGCGEFETLSTWMQVPSFRRLARPDFVLQLGSSPVSGGWEPWIESLTDNNAADGQVAEHWVLAEAGDPDPVSTASALLIGDLASSIETLASGLRENSTLLENSAWRPWHGWLENVDRLGQKVIYDAAAVPGSEASIAGVVTGTVPKGGLLALGNSLAVRLAETSSAGNLVSGRNPVWHQRGLNGIDGIPSGVAGSLAALDVKNRSQDRQNRGRGRAKEGALPGHLLIGDVSLLHDLGGLATLQSPACVGLSVVVIDNGGGRIFDRLPVGGLGLEDSQARFFSTPPVANLQKAAEMFGLGFEEAQDSAHLGELLSQVEVRSAARIVRVKTAPGQEALDHRALLANLHSVLPASPPSH